MLPVVWTLTGEAAVPVVLIVKLPLVASTTICWISLLFCAVTVNFSGVATPVMLNRAPTGTTVRLLVRPATVSIPSVVLPPANRAIVHQSRTAEPVLDLDNRITKFDTSHASYKPFL
jgi:hypothetical protein